MMMNDQIQRTDASLSPLPPSRPRRSARGRIAGGILAVLMLGASACSFIVQGKTDQCKSDADCEHFGNHPSCQEGVCVESNLGPPGCFFGNASTQEQLENRCTTAQCVKFDNCKRLNLCDGGELPALVDPPQSP
jgi:hypothetical protein